MSATESDVGTISALLARLREQASHEMLTALARELTNHVYLTGTFGLSANGELKARDVQMILDRWDLVLRTIVPSAPGPEAYRPPPPSAPLRRPLVDLNRLDTELRSPPGQQGGEQMRQRG